MRKSAVIWAVTSLFIAVPGFSQAGSIIHSDFLGMSVVTDLKMVSGTASIASLPVDDTIGLTVPKFAGSLTELLEVKASFTLKNMFITREIGGDTFSEPDEPAGFIPEGGTAGINHTAFGFTIASLALPVSPLVLKPLGDPFDVKFDCFAGPHGPIFPAPDAPLAQGCLGGGGFALPDIATTLTLDPTAVIGAGDVVLVLDTDLVMSLFGGVPLWSFDLMSRISLEAEFVVEYVTRSIPAPSTAWVILAALPMLGRRVR